jgi:hypothetical protein
MPDREAEARSRAEWNDRLISCLREEGWPVTVTQEGFDVDFSQSSEEAFFASEAACRERIGDYPTPAPLTAEEIEGLYRLSLDALDCLKGLGVEVDHAPSLELYTQQYRESMKGGPAPWTPFQDVENLAAVEQTCRQPSLDDL